jgi:hypothetical protein
MYFIFFFLSLLEIYCNTLYFNPIKKRKVKKMREKRSALIQGKITPTLKDHVQKYADKHDLSESDVVQKALKFFLSRTTRNYK